MARISIALAALCIALVAISVVHAQSEGQKSPIGDLTKRVDQLETRVGQLENRVKTLEGFQQRLGQSGCPQGQFIRSINLNGDVTCGVDQDTK